MENNPISVKDKVILITGAFGLIGKEISRSFLENQAKVVLAGHNKDAVNEIEDEFSAEFPSEQFLACHVDVTERGIIDACLKKSVDKFKRIDVLVNNAAIDAKFDKPNISRVDSSRFENYPVELIRKSVEVNVIGTIQMTQASCKQMLKQGSGNIINVASSYSIVAPNKRLYDVGEPETVYKPIDYVATKSFLPNYTRYIATYYAKENIRCNAIAPHGVYNDHDERFIANFAKLSPLGRMCDRSELNGPFLFLASDASSYMTGSILVVDGGWTAW